VNTSGSGVATLTVPVGVHTKYRVSAKATTGLAAPESATTTVHVKAKVTITATSPAADRVTVTAQVSPHQAVKASLQRKINGTWTTISSRTTNTAGSVTFTKGAPSGQQSFRVLVASSSIAGNGLSGTRTITVK
jgi:hypothetical protein